MFGLKPRIAQISAAELEEQLKQLASVYVLDVRTPAEFKQGHIPQAKLVPLAELGSRLHEIPQERTVITVCHSGSRSRVAASWLQQAGYEVKNLVGGMLRWRGPVC